MKHDGFENGTRVIRARDRSKHKKQVLVVDHYIPQPDRDSGSRTMFHLMLSLVEAGLTVKFWPENLHFDPVYTPQLQQLGIEVIYGAEYAGRFENWARENKNELDYAILSRPHISEPFIKALRKHTDAKLVYYGHDIHHLRMAEELKLWPDNADLQIEQRRFRDLEHRIWRSVDAVYYPSESEVDFVNSWAKQEGKSPAVFQLPCFAFDSFKEDPSAGLDDRRGILMVAGFAHTPNIDGAKWFIDHALPAIREKVGPVPLYLVGSNPPDSLKVLASDDIVVTGFVSDEVLQSYYALARLSIAPLRYGAGVKGKVVEAMRNGLPVVTTSTGAQGFSHDHALLVADDPGAFAAHVVTLLSDRAEWIARAEKNAALAKELFSTDAMRRALALSFDLG